MTTFKQHSPIKPNSYWILLAILFFLVLASSTLTAANNQTDKEAQKAVLVTGASTGIGHSITELLASKGYYVFAGARKDKDLKALNLIKNVESIRLDVTMQKEIDAAVAHIKKSGKGLYGLVNNAGVAIIAPLIETKESELEFLFDVNVYGPYRVTKAFAPLIIESKGRITTIGSISGILSGRFFGPYSMSKHAMEAYTDSLATEMADFDVQVSVIEPGNYNSEIGKSLKKRVKKQKVSYQNSRYKDQMQAYINRDDGSRDQHKDPAEVADAALHAIFSEKPKRRYMVVPNQQEADWTIRQAMREMLQLNQDQPFTYSQADLVKMMDELQKQL